MGSNWGPVAFKEPQAGACLPCPDYWHSTLPLDATVGEKVWEQEWRTPAECRFMIRTSAAGMLPVCTQEATTQVLGLGSPAATKESRSGQNRKGLCVKDPMYPGRGPMREANGERQPAIASAPGKKGPRLGLILLIQLQKLAPQCSWCVCRYDYVFFAWVCLYLAFQLPGGTRRTFTDEL